MAPASRSPQAIDVFLGIPNSPLHDVFQKKGGSDAIRDCFIDFTHVLIMGKGIAEKLCMELMEHHPERVPYEVKNQLDVIHEQVRSANLPHVKRTYNAAVRAFKNIGVPEDNAEEAAGYILDAATIKVLENRYPKKPSEYQWTGDTDQGLQRFHLTRDTVTLGFKNDSLRKAFCEALSQNIPGNPRVPDEALASSKMVVLKTKDTPAKTILDLLNKKFGLPDKNTQQAGEIFFPDLMERLHTGLNAEDMRAPLSQFNPREGGGSYIGWDNADIVVRPVLENVPFQNISFHFSRDGLPKIVQIICRDGEKAESLFRDLKEKGLFTPETRLPDVKKGKGDFDERNLYIPRGNIKDINALTGALQNMGMAMSPSEENLMYTLLNYALQKEAGRGQSI